MKAVRFYRDEALPYEMKICQAITDLSYKKHSHEEHSIGLVEEGHSRFWCEGMTQPVLRRGLVFIPGGAIHACNPDQAEGWRYAMVYVHPSWATGMTSFLAKNCWEQKAVIRDLGRSHAFRRVQRIFHSLEAPGEVLAKEAALMELFGAVGGERREEWILERPQPHKELKLVQEYIQSFFQERITLQQLEEVSGLNRFLIINLFKKEFSISPHRYQTLLKINYAKQELRRQHSIADVAYAAGFYDQSHFHKTFKQQVGVTPEMYQCRRKQ